MDEHICKYHCYRKKQKIRPNKIKKGSEIKLVIFDMDGVLIDIVSSWKWVHDCFGVDNKQSVNAYLHGDIDDLEFIRRDISLWHRNGEKATVHEITEMLNNVPLTDGVEECIHILRKHNVKTAIVSAGLDILAKRISYALGIDYVVANGIKADEAGKLTGDGIVRVGLMEKGESVRRLAKKLGIPLENCASIGNSCFDISMFETCGLGIAFNPEDRCVEKEADVVIREKDLRKIVPIILQNS